MLRPVATKAPEIVSAGLDEVAAARALFRAYAEWLDYAVCFEGFERELNELPGDYVAPGGGLWLARVGDEPAGEKAE